jgi:hypothetical protein
VSIEDVLNRREVWCLVIGTPIFLVIHAFWRPFAAIPLEVINLAGALYARATKKPGGAARPWRWPALVAGALGDTFVAWTEEFGHDLVWPMRPGLDAVAIIIAIGIISCVAWTALQALVLPALPNWAALLLSVATWAAGTFRYCASQFEL